MSNLVILHHAGCPDGFGAAWLLARNFDNDVAELVPMEWHREPPLDRCKDAHVWSVDWCPDAEYMRQIAETAASFVVLDHHQSSLNEARRSALPLYESLADFMPVFLHDEEARVGVVIDQTRSGIGLVAALIGEIEHEDVAPWFVKHIEDRDLWRFDFTDTAAVGAAISSYPQTVEAWDALAERDQREVIAEGRAVNRFREQLIETTAHANVLMQIGKTPASTWTLRCSVSPYPIGSDVAGLLAATNGGLGAYAILHQDHVQIGLRSRGDGPDVAKIAEEYGGGGHEHASGLRLTYDEFAAMLRPDHA